MADQPGVQAWKKAIESYLVEVVPNKSDLITLCKAIQDNEVQLYMVVEHLENYLTSKDVDKRCKGSRLLADVQHGLPRSFMKEKELEFVTAFFCDRLKDHHSVVPHVLYGLLSVCKCDNLGDSQAIKLLQAIFQDVHTQSHVLTDRRNVFTIFVVLLEKKLSCLVHILGVNFVYGYIQAMDGEKDPRNLIIIFNTLPMIVENFPLGQLVEDIFDVVSCYFPVDFDPPPNNPFGVTHSDLEIGLRKCMTASPKFAEFCIPLLQEKLESALINAKLDSLKCLQEAACKYGVEEMKTFIPPLWSILRKQYFSATTSEVESAILSVITSLTKCSASDKNPDTLDEFLSNTLKECKHHIMDTDNILRDGGAKILQAVACGSASSCYKVLTTVLPLVIQRYPSLPPSIKKDCLFHVSSVVEVASKYNQLSHETEIVTLINEIAHLMLCELSASSENICLASLTGLVAVVHFPKHLNEKLLDNVFKNAAKLAFSKQPEIFSEKITKLITSLGKYYPDETKCCLVPQVCTVIENFKSETEHSSYDSVVKTTIAISTSDDIVLPVTQSLVIAIKKMSFSLNEKDVKFLKSTLSCLKSITNGSTLPNSCIEIIYCEATLVFIELLVNCAVEQPSVIALSNIEILTLFAESIHAVAGKLNDRLASAIVDIVINLFFHKDRKVDCDIIKFSSLDDFMPLQYSSNQSQARLVLIAEAVLGCISCNIIRVNFSFHEKFLNKLLIFAYSSNDQHARESAARCLAAIMNKLENNQNTENAMNAMISSLTVILNGDDVVKKTRALNVWSWLCKASVMSSHPSGFQLTDKLIELLDDPELGKIASDGFSIIVKDSTSVLNPNCKASVMFMFKQRFFIDTNERLLDGFNSSPEHLKTNFLMALSHQFQFLPNQVLLSETKKLVPVLVRSLSIKNPSVLISSLQTIVIFMYKNPEAFLNQLDAITSHLLKLSGFKESLTVRKSSLECLKTITSQPDHLLLPLKPNVIRTIGNYLGDHKRLVRQAAAEASCAWHLVGSPGS